MPPATHIHRAPSLEDTGVSALFGLPFVVYLVALLVATSPIANQWAQADPILGIADPTVTLLVVPALGLLAAVVWWRLAPPSGAAARRGALFALAGVAVTGTLVGALRLAHGATLPAFIPPEESSAPGFLLSMTAGLGEEVLFRLFLLPVVFFGLRRFVPPLAALAVAVLVTGFGFALLHELGPSPYEASYFATRFVLPGCVMSVAWYAINPTFIVVAHASAHLFIPLAFGSVPVLGAT